MHIITFICWIRIRPINPGQPLLPLALIKSMPLIVLLLQYIQLPWTSAWRTVMLCRVVKWGTVVPMDIDHQWNASRHCCPSRRLRLLLAFTMIHSPLSWFICRPINSFCSKPLVVWFGRTAQYRFAVCDVGGEQHDKLHLSHDNARHRRSLFCLKKRGSIQCIWIGGGDRRSEEPSFRRGNIQCSPPPSFIVIEGTVKKK